MERVELQAIHKCLQTFPKFPLWIIEHVWAYKMTDIQQVADPSTWPEMDSQPLSLEDSWRLRVASAQAYSIMKNRDVEHFERVMGFLDDTYRLLPRLVAPIKHMKIMFGLKTMAIMWMLREGRGMVDTVFKINQFFPNKLPQYQDKCNQREMFLMRKNHLDFKAMAQALAMDKAKLDDYVTNQMEEQYGEHYAQKVEDRLLHYLRELETVLPGDTYIDKIQKKESPVTEEEKLLLDVITSDSQTIATTLKNLLNCDAASCSLGRVSCSSKHGNNTTERSQLLKSVQDGNSSKALQKEVEVKTTSACQQAVFRGEEKANQDVSKDSPLLLETDKDSDAGTHMDQDNKLAKRLEEESSHEEKDKISQGNSDGVQRASSSPQFCLKHQRWVKSILQQCPDECSEELQLQARVSLSPLLFQSSSSVTSSQDLTPSNLVPPAQTSTYPQIAKACEQANPEDKLSSRMESNISQMEPLLQPSSPTDTPLPALLLPVVRLVDIASVRGTFHASSNPFTASSNKLAASISSPHTLSSIHYYTSNAATHPETTKNCTFDQSDTFSPINPVNPTQLQSGYPGAPISTSSQPPTKKKKSFSRLSRKFRRACATKRQSQAQDRSNQNPVAEKIKMVPTAFLTNGPSLDDFTVSWPPTQDASTSKSGTSSPVSSPHQNHLSSSSLSSSLLSLSQQVSQIGIISHFQSSLPCTVASFTFNPNNMADGSETTSVQRDQLRLSLPSQAVLLQSKLLQPYVSLNRLSSQDCHQMTKGRSSTRHVEEEAEEDVDSSFDLHVLYSSYSSSSSEDSRVCDPDYKPRINKKRLLLEYEAARNPIHT